MQNCTAKTLGPMEKSEFGHNTQNFCYRHLRKDWNLIKDHTLFSHNECLRDTRILPKMALLFEKKKS
jgi:hypothetical protein